MLAATFKAFAYNTSMHGVKYVADEKKRPRERKFWAAVLVLSIIGCVYMVALLWNTFISKPTRVYTESIQASTDVIPFPAVTICNTNIISKTKVKKFINNLQLHNEDKSTVERAFEALLAFKFILQVEFKKSDLDILQRVLLRNRYTIAEVMRLIAYTCGEVLVKCSWLGKEVKCGEIFRQSISSTGYCCSFNYNVDRQQSSYKYTLYPGFIMGLSVLLNAREEREKVSYRSTNGMEVAIHHSDDYPGARTYRKTLSTGLQTFVQVSGSTLQVSEEVSMLPSDKRGCVFPSEMQLRYFPDYTQSNCYLECEMLFILQKCGCVPYFYDFGAGAVCNPSEITCLFEVKYRNYSKLDCNCPNTCAHTKYRVVTSSTYLIKSEACTWSFMSDTNITKDTILVSVFFASQAQVVFRRDVVDSTIYLLASFGGIFGLFLGWSFITGAEIVYYFIVRIIVERKLKNSTKRQWNQKNRKRLPSAPSYIYEPRRYLP